VPLDIVIRIFEFVVIIFSLCVHESAHAWMASRLGDQTARLQGRITLNPAYHVDPIGTLLIPGLAIFGPLIGLGFFGRFLIGWARPVPVNTRNFRKIVRDDNLTTVAGPASNLLLAFISFVILIVIIHAVPEGRLLVTQSFDGIYDNISAFPVLMPVIILLTLGIYINLSLCFFNLLPVPPLDGSHFLRNMLPYNAVQVYDRIPIYLTYIVIILFGGIFISFFMGPSLMLIELGLHYL
jgi:Zn-dependent protease